jgi:hypothetical protein
MGNTFQTSSSGTSTPTRPSAPPLSTKTLDENLLPSSQVAPPPYHEEVKKEAPPMYQVPLAVGDHIVVKTKEGNLMGARVKEILVESKELLIAFPGRDQKFSEVIPQDSDRIIRNPVESIEPPLPPKAIAELIMAKIANEKIPWKHKQIARLDLPQHIGNGWKEVNLELNKMCNDNKNCGFWFAVFDVTKGRFLDPDAARGWSMEKSKIGSSFCNSLGFFVDEYLKCLSLERTSYVLCLAK